MQLMQEADSKDDQPVWQLDGPPWKTGKEEVRQRHITLI